MNVPFSFADFLKPKSFVECGRRIDFKDLQVNIDASSTGIRQDAIDDSRSIPFALIFGIDLNIVDAEMIVIVPVFHDSNFDPIDHDPLVSRWIKLLDKDSFLLQVIPSENLVNAWAKSLLVQVK